MRPSTIQSHTDNLLHLVVTHTYSWSSHHARLGNSNAIGQAAE